MRVFLSVMGGIVGTIIFVLAWPIILAFIGVVILLCIFAFITIMILLILKAKDIEQALKEKDPPG